MLASRRYVPGLATQISPVKHLQHPSPHNRSGHRSLIMCRAT